MRQDGSSLAINAAFCRPQNGIILTGLVAVLNCGKQNFPAAPNSDSLRLAGDEIERHPSQLRAFGVSDRRDDQLTQATHFTALPTKSQMDSVHLEDLSSTHLLAGQ